jgi:hypothetical protein
MRKDMMMKLRPSLALACVLYAGMFADSAMSCPRQAGMAAPQNATEAQSSSGVEPPLSHIEMARMIVQDNGLAKSGLIPVAVVGIDIQMDKLGDEGRVAFAKQDPAAEKAWGEKMQVLLKAKMNALRQDVARTNAQMRANGVDPNNPSQLFQQNENYRATHDHYGNVKYAAPVQQQQMCVFSSGSQTYQAPCD